MYPKIKKQKRMRLQNKRQTSTKSDLCVPLEQIYLFII